MTVWDWTGAGGPGGPAGAAAGAAGADCATGEVDGAGSAAGSGAGAGSAAGRLIALGAGSGRGFTTGFGLGGGGAFGLGGCGAGAAGRGAGAGCAAISVAMISRGSGGRAGSVKPLFSARNIATCSTMTKLMAQACCRRWRSWEAALVIVAVAGERAGMTLAPRAERRSALWLAAAPETLMILEMLSEYSGRQSLHREKRGSLAFRSAFTQHLLGARVAFAATGSYIEVCAQVGKGSHALIDRLADFTIGDVVAYTDNHGAIR